MATKSQIDKWIKERKVVWVAGLYGPYQVEVIYRDYNQTMVQQIHGERSCCDYKKVFAKREQALHEAIVTLKRLCDQRVRDLDDKLARLQELIDESTEYEYLKEFWSKDLSFLPYVYKLMKYKKDKK